jgi:NADPH:quinone reductase-like Zn-dependent oxidoreductase
MKASRLHARGDLESLRFDDAPDPHAGAGQVLIRVHAAGVTPSVRNAFFIVEANAAQLDELAQMIDAGQHHSVVDAAFPLARARQAYEHRTQRGKAALQVVDTC